VLPKLPAGVSALAAGACVSAAGANVAPDVFVSVIFCLFLFCVKALTGNRERPVLLSGDAERMEYAL
jgi:hypothetical protein